jgi:limonene 1,2-monooxygenase
MTSGPNGSVAAQTDAIPPNKMRFGIFLPPTHDVAGNTTLQFQRDLELIELADRLGFDEAWVGEHMSLGYEMIACPEMFLAAASQRTSRIRLGTAVSSLPYHHPFTLANRIMDLDHISRGRAMMGMGPGQTMSDAAMMGLDFLKSRDRMVEAAEVIVPLLRGEVVSRQTEWFTLDEARLQLEPCNPDGIDMAVASVFTPTGSTLAGRLGLGLLSIAASDLKGFENLDLHWQNLQRNAAENGQSVDRSAWRVVGSMHLAHTPEQARAEARTKILPELIDFHKAVHTEDTWEPWMEDPDTALDKWTTDGLYMFGGVATVGTPSDGVAAVRRLIDKSSGGFGCYLLFMHNAAPWEATKRSLEMFAEYVMPEIRQSNARRHAIVEWFHDNTEAFHEKGLAANVNAQKKYGWSPVNDPTINRT